MIDETPSHRPEAGFAGLLRRLRTEARLTQEELAYAAGLSPRSISDLERGISRRARKSTAGQLADALALPASSRIAFVAAARGRAPDSAEIAVQNRVASDVSGGSAARHPYYNLGSALAEARLERLIDAITAASGHGSAIGGIWLIGPTAASNGKDCPIRGRGARVRRPHAECIDRRLPPRLRTRNA